MLRRPAAYLFGLIKLAAVHRQRNCFDSSHYLSFFHHPVIMQGGDGEVSNSIDHIEAINLNLEKPIVLGNKDDLALIGFTPGQSRSSGMPGQP